MGLRRSEAAEVVLILGHCYSVYIPSALLRPVNPNVPDSALAYDELGKRGVLGISKQVRNLQLLIDQLTTRNGGMTAQQATGVWFDSDGKPYHEHVTVVTWWFNHWDAKNRNDTFHQHVNGIVEAMFACGEKCVAVEYHSPHTPTRMEMRVPEEEMPPS